MSLNEHTIEIILEKMKPLLIGVDQEQLKQLLIEAAQEADSDAYHATMDNIVDRMPSEWKGDHQVIDFRQRLPWDDWEIR
jgi:hypothetical protein